MRSNDAAWTPLVTAMVPSYNAEAFIAETLESLAAQTWPHLEILIGDDASKDRTPDIIRAFASKHANVRVLDREANLGWLGNSNDLMANAAGELVFFAFHDDTLKPDYVEKLVDGLRDYPDAVLAYSDVELVETDGRRLFLTCPEMDREGSVLRRGLRMIRTRRDFHWWIPNRGLFRKTAFDRIGGIQRNAYGEFSADWTWLLHLSLLGPFVRVPETLCRKAYQKTSLSINWRRNSARYRALWRAAIHEVQRSPVALPTKAVLSASLWLRIAASAVKSRLKPAD